MKGPFGLWVLPDEYFTNRNNPQLIDENIFKIKEIINMKIKILGTGCPKCEKLEKIVRDTLDENDIEAEIEKVEKMKDIMAYNVMMTPALVIDGEVKSSGSLPDKEDILKWLE